jgi:hypothetical protein
MKDAVRRYWPVLAATAVLVPHALLFDFVNDDAYISFRYAKNLALHGQLVFNLGERVEGFTNFLWTILLAIGIKLGVSPVVSSRFLGVALGVGTLAVVVRLSLRLDRERPSPWHLVAPLGLAATGAFACWCTGGLETMLFTFLSLLAFERLLGEIDAGRGAESALWFALAGMTRPEGVLFFGIAGLVRLALNLGRERRVLPRRHELAWVGLFVLVFAPYFAWRWRYFGWPFPNTFYVKSSGSARAWELGLYYLRRFAEDYGVLFLVGVGLAGWPAREDRIRRALFVLTAVLWAVFAVYVVKVGGDFMGLYRFILPVLPLGAVALQEAMRGLARRLAPLVGRPALALAGLTLAAGFVVGSVKVSRKAATSLGPDGYIDTPGYLRWYAEQRIPVGVWLGKYAQPDDLAVVGGAGVIPYYSGIRSFDVYGLVDETVAHDKSMTIADRPGHQKWASPAYVLSRRPTLITHVYCLDGYGGGCDERIPWAGYEWVEFTAPGITAVHYRFMKRADRSFGPFAPRSP